MLKSAVVFALVSGLVLLGLNLAMDGKVRMYYPKPKFEMQDIPDLSGKVCLVTGANTGLGFATSVELVRKGCKVYIGTRSATKNSNTAKKIEKLGLKGKPVVLDAGLDLSSFDSIREYVKAFQKVESSLNVLINNAGIMFTPFGLTKDGFEQQFGVNHLGHFLLTMLLMPSLEKGAPSRIVSVSSNGHWGAYSEGIRLEHNKLNDEASYSRFQAYGQSKLANILFAKELAKRTAGKKIYVNAAHPGFVYTELQRNFNNDLSNLFGKDLVQIFSDAFSKTFGLSSTDGSLTQLYLATSPDVEKNNINGEYYVPTARLATEEPLALSFTISKHAQDDALAKKLWDFSVNATMSDYKP